MVHQFIANVFENMFEDTKVITSLYDDEFPGTLNKDFSKRAVYQGVGKNDLDVTKIPNHANLQKLAVNYSDGVIKGSAKLSADLEKHLKKAERPVLDFQSPEDYIAAYDEFYEQVLEEESIFA